MKTMNYNNLRKVARKFIGSAATKMSKQAILLAIGRLSAGDMTGIITTTTIDNAEILNHATNIVDGHPTGSSDEVEVQIRCPSQHSQED